LTPREEAEKPKTNKLDDIPFIKNIENIQGDERDIIIFSTGCAEDVQNTERHHITIRFGSINQAGGENRLNVAVTRARQEIIIISSFDPNNVNA
jgi:superfamily I DNA and/or RNA helicase